MPGKSLESLSHFVNSAPRQAWPGGPQNARLQKGPFTQRERAGFLGPRPSHRSGKRPVKSGYAKSGIFGRTSVSPAHFGLPCKRRPVVLNSRLGGRGATVWQGWLSSSPCSRTGATCGFGPPGVANGCADAESPPRPEPGGRNGGDEMLCVDAIGALAALGHAFLVRVRRQGASVGLTGARVAPLGRPEAHL